MKTKYRDIIFARFPKLKEVYTAIFSLSRINTRHTVFSLIEYVIAAIDIIKYTVVFGLITLVVKKYKVIFSLIESIIDRYNVVFSLIAYRTILYNTIFTLIEKIGIKYTVIFSLISSRGLNVVFSLVEQIKVLNTVIFSLIERIASKYTLYFSLKEYITKLYSVSFRLYLITLPPVQSYTAIFSMRDMTSSDIEDIETEEGTTIGFPCLS